jgi:hypothetical protein
LVLSRTNFLLKGKGVGAEKSKSFFTIHFSWSKDSCFAGSFFGSTWKRKGRMKSKYVCALCSSWPKDSWLQVLNYIFLSFISYLRTPWHSNLLATIHNVLT